MRNNVKISFWLIKSKHNPSKQCPLYMKIFFQGKGIKVATGHYINPTHWDKKKKKLKGSTQEAHTINESLASLRAQVIMIVNKLILAGVPFNIHTIKDRLSGKEHKNITVTQACDNYIDMMKSLSVEYSKPTIIKYRNTKLRLMEYMRSKYGRGDLFLYELNNEFIREWEMFLKTKIGNSQVTCYKHYQRFTRMIRVAMQKGYLQKYPFDDYTIKLPKKEVQFLTIEEIGIIEDKHFEIERLEIVKDMFIFSCYTGLAFMEVTNLTEENLYIGNDNELWLKMVRQKTKKEFKIPLLPQAIKIINKYKDHPFSIKKKRLLPIPTNQKFNAYIQEVGDICGIKKKLHHHLARKSFSVSIALANNVPVETLSKMLGHSSISVTLNAYASITDQKISNDFANLKKNLAARNKSRKKKKD
ncbi:MAG: site-specific integrase [Cyclobacteriaceae bacterium]|nr:site-specific integrase [Cyclobacteriaceae bacterium]